MSSHFSHHLFQHFDFHSIPLNHDIYLMDEMWLSDWESAYLNCFNGAELNNVGYINHASIRNIRPEALEISWYPNIIDRFHEVTVLLPKSAFIVCIDVFDYDEKPHIFVKKEWLDSILLRPYSAFALIDAIGVKDAILCSRLSSEKLIELRARLDQLADSLKGVAFVSFADSLLLKANWYIGKYDSATQYSYEPESLIRLIPEISQIYKDVLNMNIYSILTQGANEYIDAELIHQSQTNSHISLNCLGLPFAKLLAIDDAAREAIRKDQHPRSEIYIDQQFLHSIRFKHLFDKQQLPSNTYKAPMSSDLSKYYFTDMETILENLAPDASNIQREHKAKS